MTDWLDAPRFRRSYWNKPIQFVQGFFAKKIGILLKNEKRQSDSGIFCMYPSKAGSLSIFRF